MNVIPSADRNAVFVEAGCVSLRNPDGTFQPARPLFLAVDTAEITSTGITRGEEKLCDDIGKTLAKKFGEYLEGVRRIERLQKKGGKT